MGEQLYVGIWKEYLSRILSAMQENGSGILLDCERFYNAGNRQNYGFRLDIKNGVVPIKEGSAVARDLKSVLDNSPKFASLAKDKTFTIRMGKDFILHVIQAQKT